MSGSRAIVWGVVVALTTVLAGMGPLDAQAPGILRISVTLVEGGQPPRPVPRHALLVSDDPPGASPRRVVTGADGSVSMRLPPGRYLVESEQAIVLQGRGFEWRQAITVAAGAEVTLALSDANAEAGAPASEPGATPPKTADATDVLFKWQDSVVALWTSTQHASGTVVDGQGLVVTNQQVVGSLSTVEVQISPTLRVEGRVLHADAALDVAVLWVDRSAVTSIPPLPLGCAVPPLADGQEILALGVPRGRPTRMSDGRVNRVASRTMISDLIVENDALGGPVFTENGALVGLTSTVAEKEGDPLEDTRVVRVDAVCDAVAAARRKMATTSAPRAAPLPLDGAVVPEEVLARLAKQRVGALNPSASESPSFTIAFLTPIQAYGGRESMDFANWSGYVLDFPKVLLVRVTPKMAEKFWVKVFRGVAVTQGVMLPPIRQFKPGFASMRAHCDGVEVPPVHPFRLARRTSETDAIYEGLYAFQPEAFPPTCQRVTLQLFSEKDPTRGEAIAIDPAILEKIRQDFAAVAH